MDIQRINQHTSAFNDITHYIESDNGKEKVEVWFARELQSVLGYARWENFTIAIGRAVESCKSHLIAQNGDPKKEEIAFAQGYFTLQTKHPEQCKRKADAGATRHKTRKPFSC